MVADLGLLALRLALGLVFLGHGTQKAFGAFGGPGFAGATGFIESIGFRPARLWTALAVGGELAAGLLFVLGLWTRSEEHTSELQSQSNLVCRLLLEKKKKHDNIRRMLQS